MSGLTGRRAVVTGAAVTVVARSRPGKSGNGFGDDFVAADSSTGNGAAVVAEHVHASGAPDILVHVAGGSSAPFGGFRQSR